MHEIELHDLKDLIIVYLKDLRLTILALTRRWHATQQCDAMQHAQETTANFVYFFTNFPRFELSIKQKKKKALIRENSAFSLAHLFDVYDGFLGSSRCRSVGKT